MVLKISLRARIARESAHRLDGAARGGLCPAARLRYRPKARSWPYGAVSKPPLSAGRTGHDSGGSAFRASLAEAGIILAAAMVALNHFGGQRHGIHRLGNGVMVVLIGKRSVLFHIYPQETVSWRDRSVSRCDQCADQHHREIVVFIVDLVHEPTVLKRTMVCSTHRSRTPWQRSLSCQMMTCGAPMQTIGMPFFSL